MGVNYTPEQRRVIDAPTGNILVSAAAGSGKTAVLVERILSMITRPEDPLEIDEILVVTFTNNAAAQMRERIRNSIEERLEAEPENVHLQRQARNIAFANIMTIDAFCQALVKRYFYMLDIDPGFRIADEIERRLLWQETVNEVLERHLEEGEASFLALLERYGGSRGDRQIETYIEGLHRFADSAPWPEKWLREAVQTFRIADAEQLKNASYLRELTEYANRELEDAERIYKKAELLCMEEDGPKAYVEAIQADQAWIVCLLRENDYDRRRGLFVQYEYPRLSGRKQEGVSETKKTLVKELRDKGKKLLTELYKKYYSVDLDRHIEQLSQCAEPMQRLVELTIACNERMLQRQKEENAYGFSDIEHMALRLLLDDTEDGPLPTEVARQYRKQFREIMIDEYQDSNQIQDLLLHSLSTEEEGRPNVFMVGDVKQSIYKFRMAKPELFLEKYQSFTENPAKGTRMDLGFNFRSHASVLRAVNQVFERIMQPSVGGILYDETAKLHFPKAEEEDDLRRNEFLLCVGTEESEEGELLSEKEQTVIGAVEKYIRRMTDERNGYMTGAGDAKRPLRYGDIVILVRAMTGIAYPLIDALKARGIPTKASSMTGYFESREVQNVLNLLRILENPLQDVPFTAVLRSQIGGFVEEDLAQLRIFAQDHAKEGRTAYGYELLCALRSLSPCTEALQPLKDKAVVFLTCFEYLRECSMHLPVSELLEEIYRTTGCAAIASAMPTGAVREKNLRMLVRKAKQFAKGKETSLHDFVSYIDRMISYEVSMMDDGSDSEEQAVRVMTIHASKGLEFPAVILVDTERRFNLRDANESIVMHEELGIGPDVIDPVRRTKTATPVKLLIGRRKRLEMLGEELRVLYVAMTRAKDYLAVTGYVGDVSKLNKLALPYIGTEEPLSFSDIGNASSYLSWLLAAIFGMCESTAYEEWLASDMRELLLGDWTVSVSKLTDAYFQENSVHSTEQSMEGPVKKELFEEYMRVLENYHAFCYPYRDENPPPVKVSVSELKHAAMEEREEDMGVRLGFVQEQEREEPIPAFVQEKKPEPSGTDRGTLYHRVLELHDYALPLTEAACREELKQMADRRQIAETDVAMLSVSKLVAFYASPIGLRMQAAEKRGQLHREQAFVMRVPATRVNKEYRVEDTVLVQGIMDAFFVEEGEIVLLDYKTDHIENANNPEAVLAERYREQLSLYAEAIERGTGLKVKEKLIYSFGLQKEILL